jgi:hypothetical protein
MEVLMPNFNTRAITLLQQLVEWYDREFANDDNLERIVSEARDLLQGAEPGCQRAPATPGEYVLYDIDHERLLSGDVYPSYADAAANAAGLDDVLILRLPLPFKKPPAAEAVEDDSRCDCELPGFFCCGVPGILAHLEGDRVAPAAKVERCDQCQRYESDEAARQKLIELGLL